MTTLPPVMYSQPWSPTPSTTAVAPELRTQKRSPATPEMYAAPDKAEELLHWHAEKTIEDCCRDTWNFQKNIADELRVLRSE